MYWSYFKGNVHGDEPPGVNGTYSSRELYFAATEGFEREIGARSLDAIHAVGEEIIGCVINEICEGGQGEDYDARLNINLSNRNRGGNVGHTDRGFITVWFGSTQPGLRVGEKAGGIDIPDVPVGHALVWRGDKLLGKEIATKHTVIYRGASPRVSAICF